MKGKYDRTSSLCLLAEKQATLRKAGLSRYPQRSDFSREEVCAIKAFLGPWPRALEAAGLKPAKTGDPPGEGAGVTGADAAGCPAGSADTAGNFHQQSDQRSKNQEKGKRK